MEDKALIINGKWLNDNLVNAGHQLLVTTSTSEQVLECYIRYTLAFEIQKQEFIQILHTDIKLPFQLLEVQTEP